MLKLKTLDAFDKIQEVDCVVVYTLDRLSRETKDSIEVTSFFRRHRVNFVAVTQIFDNSTPMGKFVQTVLSGAAQLEREMIVERVKNKIATSKEQGLWMGGTLPLGYDVKDKELIINEKEANEELNRFNWSEKEFIAYEQEIKRIRDEQAVLAQKLDDTTQKGRQEGIQIGHEKGKAEGKEEGRKAEQIEVTKNLLKVGVSIDIISQTTGLPQAEIAQLKEEIS